jgi:hypothetical protein
MSKNPKAELDETTRQIAARMLAMPPKRHDEMKIGKAKPKRGKSPARQPSDGQSAQRRRTDREND